MVRSAARRRPPELVLPEVNSLIRLTVGSSPDPDDTPVAANLPSRVEDVVRADPRSRGSVTEVFVAVPSYAGDVDVPRPRTACSVSWVTRQGVYELPCAFVDRVSVGPVVRAWRLAVTAPARRAQRRRFVRVPWTARIEVEVVPVAPGMGVAGASEVDGDGGPAAVYAEGPCVLHANALDLSEGGLRCLLAPPPLRDGQPVRVQLDVEGQRLVLDGTVIRVRSGRRAPGGPVECETGIAFTEPDEFGDLLRRAVFTEQLRSRRSGVE